MRPGNENFACQEVDTFTSWNIPRKFKKFHWYVQIFDKYLKKNGKLFALLLKYGIFSVDPPQVLQVHYRGIL